VYKIYARYYGREKHMALDIEEVRDTSNNLFN
jgi:hypothetical protein